MIPSNQKALEERKINPEKKFILKRNEMFPLSFEEFWWVYILVALCLLGGIYLIIRIRIRHFQHQQKLLEEKINAKTLELEREKKKFEAINYELESRVKERTNELMNSNTSLKTEIEERKTIENALRISEEKFRLMIENANDAIFIVQDGIIKFPNPKTLDMFGYSLEELKNIYLDHLIHPEDKEKYKDGETNNKSENISSNNNSIRVINKKNKDVWVDRNSIDIIWEEKPAILHFFRDITEKKRLENQLIEAQKMKAIGTLAGGIAHDFNNLLMGILGNISLVLSEMDSNHPHYSELRNVEHFVHSGAHLTRQLLDLARGGKYEVKATDLNQVVEKSADLFCRTKKEIILQKDFEPDLWVVEIDQRQIEQALLNLYLNAWQAMPDGGNIYLQTENIILREDDTEIYGIPPGNYVKSSITDTGFGMDEATRQRIFEPFFTTKESGIGTGLGLTSVYAIISNHNGNIQVYSEKGKGTTFHIFLPASEKTIEPEKTSPDPYLNGSATILLVDDEDMIIDIGERLLKKLGYTVLIAKSGKEAIELYKSHIDRIDLVILDIVMPGMGGGITFDQLLKINPDIKVLLSSGYSLDGEAAAILDRGCKGFIQKPFRLKEISHKVHSILESAD